MCDMQKMPAREDASCEEEEMNFAAFSAVSGSGSYVTGGQPGTKVQQNNASPLSQVVGMVGADGSVQYMRTDGTPLHTPQIISLPIALPGSKPGDPQQTVQIQVLNPSMLQQQQQPKYQMQIPIQGFQQGGAVLTLQYSPEGVDGSGFPLVGQNALSESGVQMLAGSSQDMLLQQPDNKSQMQTNVHQVFITPSQQIIITNPADSKPLNNNTTSNNNNEEVHETVVVKEECDDVTMQDDESSQGTENSEAGQWSMASTCQQELVEYFNSLPPHTGLLQAQELPRSLQKFLKLNPAPAPRADADPDKAVIKKPGPFNIEGTSEEELVEYLNSLPPHTRLLEMQELPRSLQKLLKLNPALAPCADADLDGTDIKEEEPVAEAVVEEDGTVQIEIKKKKKYKKKPPKPARPKPGQVIITTAPDGTPKYCCPECVMAYPEKEHLEVHLLTHKIERRFICGICGAGLKRKEHLERHKLGHNPERPFVCGVCRKGFKRREHLNLHTVMHSGVKTEICNVCGKGFYRKDHLRKHTRSHENKRAREGAPPDTAFFDVKHPPADTGGNGNLILPEITIHVPTSANVQVPVQINIPQHVVTSLAAAQAHQQQQQLQHDTQAQLEALLAQHT